MVPRRIIDLGLDAITRGHVCTASDYNSDRVKPPDAVLRRCARLMFEIRTNQRRNRRCVGGGGGGGLFLKRRNGRTRARFNGKNNSFSIRAIFCFFKTVLDGRPIYFVLRRNANTTSQSISRPPNRRSVRTVEFAQRLLGRWPGIVPVWATTCIVDKYGGTITGGSRFSSD